MRQVKRSFLLVLVSVFTVISVSFAEEQSFLQKIKNRFNALNKAQEPASKTKETSQSVKMDDRAGSKATKTRIVKREMTQAEMVTHLKDAFDEQDGLLEVIPEMRREKDAAGNVFYTYNGKALKMLDPQTLKEISNRVNNESVRLRAKRLSEQLETVNRAKTAANAGKLVPRIPEPPPAPPKSYTPLPTPPSMPASVPQPPKAPSSTER